MASDGKEGLFIERLTPSLEESLKRIPALNIDTFIVPSPYVEDATLEKDYEHSYVWLEEGELLGYIQVYVNPQKSSYHIYKQVTSPFGRAKGIGTAFLLRLASEVSPDALVYLFVWEKQAETMEFFANKGFVADGRIVYRRLTFNRLVAPARRITVAAAIPQVDRTVAEELGKSRHDARKTLRLLSDMVDTLTVDNANTIIEGINRETTALINMLNAYRDTVEFLHEVNVEELILERILPLIELSTVPCEVRLHLKSRIPAAFGHFVEVGRALVNLVSNSIDAIKESGRKGVILIGLEEKEEKVILQIEDNGVGMDKALLAKGSDGLPGFVGKTTKGNRTGEGYGTRQIYAAFGRNNIRVESEKGSFTRWTIQLDKRPATEDTALRGLESRYLEFQSLVEYPVIAKQTDRSVMGSFIWQTRKMEILSWDLIVLFGKYHNIREIYRSILAYRYGPGDFDALKKEVDRLRVDDPRVREWLLDVVRMIKRNDIFLSKTIEFKDYGGMLFKSYGQSVGKTVIFTMDPETGRFLATDRKLAEHVDFCPYLGKDRDELLRGEFNGDVRNVGNPLTLGVWSIQSPEDATRKVGVIRQGCRTLVSMGINPEKRLDFYQTTYLEGQLDFDICNSTTIGELANAPDEGLSRFFACSGEEAIPFMITD